MPDSLDPSHPRRPFHRNPIAHHPPSPCFRTTHPSHRCRHLHSLKSHQRTISLLRVQALPNAIKGSFFRRKPFRLCARAQHPTPRRKSTSSSPPSLFWPALAPNFVSQCQSTMTTERVWRTSRSNSVGASCEICRITA